MHCKKIQRKLEAYPDELPADERRAIRDHLTDCDECAAELQRLRRIQDILRQKGTPPVPEGFHESVMARAREQKAGEERPGILDPFGHLSLLQTPLRAAAVAAGVIVALGIGILVGRDLAEATAARQTQPVGGEESDAVSSLGAEYLGEYPPESVSRAYANLTTTGGEQDR
ncbi:MAG: anti-sigma factor family protein [Planctomycetota bacterium]